MEVDTNFLIFKILIFALTAQNLSFAKKYFHAFSCRNRLVSFIFENESTIYWSLNKFDSLSVIVQVKSYFMQKVEEHSECSHSFTSSFTHHGAVALWPASEG